MGKQRRCLPRVKIYLLDDQVLAGDGLNKDKKLDYRALPSSLCQNNGVNILTLRQNIDTSSAIFYPTSGMTTSSQ
jgi:hypothetical protein